MPLTKPPSQIRLGPHTIWIVEGLDDDDLRGSYTAYEDTIRYADDHPSQQKLRNTIMHEALHAVFSTTGYYSEWGHDVEELVVQRITPYVLGLLRDNPDLVKFLTKADRR